MRFPPEFSPEVVTRIRDTIETTGHFSIPRVEMELLWKTSYFWATNPHELLEKLAEVCVAEIDKGESLVSARLRERRAIIDHDPGY